MAIGRRNGRDEGPDPQRDRLRRQIGSALILLGLLAVLVLWIALLR